MVSLQWSNAKHLRISNATVSPNPLGGRAPHTDINLCAYSVETVSFALNWAEDLGHIKFLCSESEPFTASSFKSSSCNPLFSCDIHSASIDRVTVNHAHNNGTVTEQRASHSYDTCLWEVDDIMWERWPRAMLELWLQLAWMCPFILAMVIRIFFLDDDKCYITLSYPFRMTMHQMTLTGQVKLNRRLRKGQANHHMHWPVSHTGIMTSNHSKWLMIVNRLLKIAHLPCTIISGTCDYAVFLKLPLYLRILSKCGTFLSLARQSLIAGNQVGFAQAVIWPLSPWWRLSLNVIM